MKKDFAIVCAAIAVIIAGLCGWILNIVKLFGFDGAIAEMGMMEIMRVVGIFVAPLGAMIGWF